MTSFLNACGVTEDSVQLVIKNLAMHGTEVRVLQQPFAVIGRTPRADVVLDHQQVSRRHVYLQVVDGWAFWIDLESRTGTRSGINAPKFGWLQGPQTLCIGPYVFQRYVGESQNDVSSARGELPRDTPLVALAYSHVSLPRVALEFLNGPSKSMSWPMHRVMSLLGSASGCKFRLTDPSVSRFHASLLRTSAGLWIVDLLGQNGITINEKPVRYGRLDDGDVLGVGRYRIRVGCRFEERGPANGSVSLPRLPWKNLTSNGFTFPEGAAALANESGSAVRQELQLPGPDEMGFSIPNLQVGPLDATLPIASSQSELVRSVLVPLVNQFGMMQQQMFDQFQQAMAMMVQMFGSMHHNQMEAIRAELEQIRLLGEEFHALKEELTHRAREGSQIGAGEPVSAPAGIDRSSAVEQGISAAGQAAKVRTPEVSPATADRPSQKQGTARVDPAPSASKQSGASEGRSEPGSACPNSEAASDRDTIVWLHKRIALLQQERESRWQKLLKLLPGVS
jgi:pSer/pThr/pTyr-binding forkhead associated (FHA) protein